MTPALAPFYARWLRIEEAKLFAEIALAGHDADGAWDAFRGERDKERPVKANEMDGCAIGAVKGKARLPDAVGVESQPSKPSERSSKPAAVAPVGSGTDEIPATNSRESGSDRGKSQVRILPGTNVASEKDVPCRSLVSGPHSGGRRFESGSVSGVPSEAGPVAQPGQSAAPIPPMKHIDIQPHRSRLRPLCLQPDNCAGYGAKTCHACLVAAGETAAA